MNQPSDLYPRPWMKSVLILASIGSLTWGILSVAFPRYTLAWFGIDFQLVTSRLWTCIGVTVGLFGFAYLKAANAPYRCWWITLVGTLGKLVGLIGLASLIGLGIIPGPIGWSIAFIDLLCCGLFATILWGAFRYQQIANSAYQMSDTDDPVRELRTNTGLRLDDLADVQPQLIVFLRHAGCTFCRETLVDIRQQRDDIESSDCGIVLVHLGDDDRDAEFFEQYGVGDIPRIASPDSRLYQQFGLDLGGIVELLGPHVLLRGLTAAIIKGNGFGRLQGNALQMPGVYLYHNRRILGGFQHAHASDRPDYSRLLTNIRDSRQIESSIISRSELRGNKDLVGMHKSGGATSSPDGTNHSHSESVCASEAVEEGHQQ